MNSPARPRGRPRTPAADVLRHRTIRASDEQWAAILFVGLDDVRAWAVREARRRARIKAAR